MKNFENFNLMKNLEIFEKLGKIWKYFEKI